MPKAYRTGGRRPRLVALSRSVCGQLCLQLLHRQALAYRGDDRLRRDAEVSEQRVLPGPEAPKLRMPMKAPSSPMKRSQPSPTAASTAMRTVPRPMTSAR
jgi:hypothetical protein